MVLEVVVRGARRVRRVPWVVVVGAGGSEGGERLEGDWGSSWRVYRGGRLEGHGRTGRAVF